MADEDDDLAAILAEAGMDANHPLFARAQAALQAQQETQKLGLVEQLREKSNELKAGKKRREDIGVELYNFQQQLAKLQMTLEKTHDEYTNLHRNRVEAEANLEALQRFVNEQKQITKGEEIGVSALQAQVDKLQLTLQEVEAHNERVKSDVAVTKRAAYAVENAVSRLEKEKEVQDNLIDGMQEQLKTFHKQLSLLEAQLEAQMRETRAAYDTLGETTAEMENIHFEKKQLAQQWKTSLLAMAKRDEALAATEVALQQQHEQALNINAEMEGLRKKTVTEEAESELRMGVLKKVEGEAELVQRGIRQVRDKRRRIKDTLEKLQQQLAGLDQEVTVAEDEGFQLTETSALIERESAKLATEALDVEQQTLNALLEETAAEKYASSSVKAVNQLRAKLRELSLDGTKVANELAKCRIEVLDTMTRNDRLKETLGAVDLEVEEKGKAVGRYETEIRRRNDEIERKTKEVDLLNKQYERLTKGNVEESLGPLENTIAQLGKGIAANNTEGKELQRRWVQLQTELVTTVSETNALTEKVARLRSERMVLSQKRARLDASASAATAEISELDKATQRMHADLTRLNTAIAKNSALSNALAEDTRNLETSAMRALRESEQECAALESKIDEVINEKRASIAEIMERERQIVLWERKIQLEKETQAALDPDVGTDVIAGMRKEIHRMEIRQGELLRMQERLMVEMERAISKRETLAVRSTMAITRVAQKAPEVSEDSLRKACNELRRSVKETERETQLAEQRIAELEEQRALLGVQLDQGGNSVADLRRLEEDLRLKITAAEKDKAAGLIATLAAQRAAKRFEDFEAGRHRPAAVPAESSLENELGKAADKRDRILAAAERILEMYPYLEPQVERVFMLAGAEQRGSRGAEGPPQ